MFCNYIFVWLCEVFDFKAGIDQHWLIYWKKDIFFLRLVAAVFLSLSIAIVTSETSHISCLKFTQNIH